MSEPTAQPGSGSGVSPTPARPNICADDAAVDESMALLFSEEAPLPVSSAIKKARGIRVKDDYKAVWAWVPKKPDQTLLLFFHGNHHYVTVDKLAQPPQKGSKKQIPGPAPPSRMPDWAENDANAQQGVAAYPAVGLFYKLDELESSQRAIIPAGSAIKKPVVIVPEDVELQQKGDWAAPPKGQYTDHAKLKRLAENCYEHLRCLLNPAGVPYLPSTKDQSGPSYVKNLNRIYLCGHSGGGKPMVESAAADLVLASAVPIDMWLFDATYGWGTGTYADFCRYWQNNWKLGNSSSQSRFVCIFKAKYKEEEWEDKKHTIKKIDPKTQEQAWHWAGTEMEADSLREAIADVLKKKPAALWIEHQYDNKTKKDNMSSDIIPALQKSAVLFIRTWLAHEDIPTKFIPVLLATAAS